MVTVYGIQCPCGGTVDRLTDGGAFYFVTEDQKIIFRGLCGNCGDQVELKKDILALLLLSQDLKRRN